MSLSNSFFIPLPDLLSTRFCRADLGDFFILAQRSSGKLPVSFSAKFDGEFFPRIFRPCFARIPGPPPPPKKFTPRIVGIPLQFHFLEPKIYSHRLSAYWGDQDLRFPNQLGSVSWPLVSDCKLRTHRPLIGKVVTTSEKSAREVEPSLIIPIQATICESWLPRTSAEKHILLQKFVHSCRKVQFLRGTSQEAAGNCRGVSGLKNQGR